MNLKKLRKQRGLTQNELAERIGIHDNTLRAWEKGEHEPRSSDIAKLCEVLGCTEKELIGPTRTEIKVNFYWEVDDDMQIMNIKANEFNFGYRNDGMLLLAGALPYEMSVDDILSQIKVELIAAKAGKEARDKTLKKEIKEIA